MVSQRKRAVTDPDLPDTPRPDSPVLGWDERSVSFHAEGNRLNERSRTSVAPKTEPFDLHRFPRPPSGTLTTKQIFVGGRGRASSAPTQPFHPNDAGHSPTMHHNTSSLGDIGVAIELTQEPVVTLSNLFRVKPGRVSHFSWPLNESGQAGKSSVRAQIPKKLSPGVAERCIPVRAKGESA